MRSEILFVIIGMSMVTQLPRIIPLVVLTRMSLPPLVVRWLKHIPVAVLSALLFPSLLLSDGRLSLSLDNTALLAAIPCMVIAAKTKNLFLTVLTGIIISALLQLVWY
ncbi:MAG: AzlD domain-containing protein [Caldicoprobacterales bacterium]|jgi:branched-subunit amino acid transport protein|nr:AzlD domain-containing protein [Clostridiales bacterium]